MSPPEIWGPAIWNMFHTFAHKIQTGLPAPIYFSLFLQIKNICSALPCPECSHDASRFLANITSLQITNKEELITQLYLFHNYVNKKKRKTLFPFSQLSIYENQNLLTTYYTFLTNYHTRGNMKLLTDSFQRQLILRTFKKWFLLHSKFFGI